MGEKGDLITVDNDLSLEKSIIFKGSRDEITHYTVADGLLMLNNEKGLYQVYNSNEDRYSIGLLEFGEKPKLAYILDDVILPNVKYKFLYHNETLEEIYMVGTDINNNGTLIIVNSDDFSMKKSIPIKYPHLLDLVITR
jgi:hypothetical protein